MTDSTAPTSQTAISERVLASWFRVYRDNGQIARESILKLLRETQRYFIRGQTSPPSVSSLDEKLKNVLNSFFEKESQWKKNPEFQHLIQLSNNPWNIKDLIEILEGTTSPPKNFCQKEKLPVCLHRLILLCKGRLFSPAFNFAQYLVRFASKDSENLNTLAALYGCLLVKLRQTKEADLLAKNLTTQTILSARNASESMTNLLMIDRKEFLDLLLSCAVTSLSYAKAGCPKDVIQKLVEEISKADSSFQNRLISRVHLTCPYSSILYTFGECLFKDAQDKTSSFLSVFNIFLRGFSIDLLRMDELLRDKKQDDLKLIKSRYSEAMVFMASLLKENPVLKRECILTAFSLQPSTRLYEMICECAKDFTEETEEVSNAETSNTAAKQSSRKQAFLERQERDFEKICGDFMGNLKEIKEKETQMKKMNKHRDGLFTIESSVLTTRPSYDPLADPLKAFDLSSFGLSREKTNDLIVVLNSPRWRMLSWILDWKVLQERCMDVLKNPSVTMPNDEQRYLVVDYTQFEEWSSDDEDHCTGIEKGYEDWEDIDSESDEREMNAK